MKKKKMSIGMRSMIKVLRADHEAETKKRVAEGRVALEKMSGKTIIPDDVVFEEIDIDGISALWVTTPESQMNKIILYLHGGGYIQGSLKTHRDLCQRISRASNARTLYIDYGIAPENPFPAGLNDAVKAYQWLIGHQDILPGNIVIAGDSAGGGLTLATLLKLRDSNIPLPAAAVCLSPWTDLTLSGETYQTKTKEDPFITFDGLAFDARLYIGDNDPKNPYISPIYGDFTGLPPLCIQVGSAEILLDDSRIVAEKAKRAGVDVTIDIWEDMIHVFQAFAIIAPEGRKGIKKIGEFIKKYLK